MFAGAQQGAIVPSVRVHSLSTTLGTDYASADVRLRRHLLLQRQVRSVRPPRPGDMGRRSSRQAYRGILRFVESDLLELNFIFKGTHRI